MDHNRHRTRLVLHPRAYGFDGFRLFYLLHKSQRRNKIVFGYLSKFILGKAFKCLDGEFCEGIVVCIGQILHVWLNMWVILLWYSGLRIESPCVVCASLEDMDRAVMDLEELIKQDVCMFYDDPQCGTYEYIKYWCREGIPDSAYTETVGDVKIVSKSRIYDLSGVKSIASITTLRDVSCWNFPGVGWVLALFLLGFVVGRKAYMHKPKTFS